MTKLQVLTRVLCNLKNNTETEVVVSVYTENKDEGLQFPVIITDQADLKALLSLRSIDHTIELALAD